MHELTHISRKWGFQTGLPLLALQGLNECSLLSADVGSSTTHHKYVKVIARVARIPANLLGEGD